MHLHLWWAQAPETEQVAAGYVLIGIDPLTRRFDGNIYRKFEFFDELQLALLDIRAGVALDIVQGTNYSGKVGVMAETLVGNT